MKKTPKSSVWILTIGAFFAFFVFGFSDNLKGTTLPAIIQDLHISYSVGGSILLGAYLGFIAATTITGFLADSIGHKAVLVIAGFCLGIGAAGYTFFSTPLFLSLSISILGFGLGSLELGCNALIVELRGGDKGKYLNLMAVLHGLGSTLAPLYAGWMLSARYSWRSVYGWDLIPIIILIIYFLFTTFPASKSKPNEKIDFTHIAKIAFTGEMIWYYIIITLYVCIEIGLSSWMVEYLQSNRHFSISSSSQALAIYFGLIMLGRFIGSFIVERLGYLQSTFYAMLGAITCVALALFGPQYFAYFLPGCGLFLSIIFPTITASVSDSHKNNMNSILGIFFTFAGLGGALGPWIIGFASDHGGLPVGFSLNLVFGILTAFSILLLMIMKKKTPSLDSL
ncbi:MAG: MFS transporter [Chloroflexota bacterium]